MICDCEECMRPVYAACRIGGEIYGLCPAHSMMMRMLLTRLACWYAALGVPKPDIMVLSQAQELEPEVVL